MSAALGVDHHVRDERVGASALTTVKLDKSRTHYWAMSTKRL